ncbi:hypothetical protein BOTNAR_0206g00140 [Botryotinia narcissicola]|uniref:Uncharacterized protein n=1 Tax=Botryotinia narcissicola TaxID=278944 RepID=A0A4Z1I6J8_9HELO|nr:hypothetical protein BOTNAR_0206g00140 [Botryotinia narcissicola]
MHAQVPPPGTTSNALVVKELISKCLRSLRKKVRGEYSRTLPEKEKAFIDYLSSKYSKMVENTNKDIQEINAELGLSLPLEKPKEISASHVEEYNLRFITAERKRSAIQKEHLKKNFDEFKLEISTIETRSSPTLPTESPDDKATIAQVLEDKLFLQNELEAIKQTVIKLEAVKKQDTTTIARCQFLYNEVRREKATLKERMKQLEEYIVHYKVVANSCSLVRHGFFNARRRFCDSGKFLNIKGRTQANKKVNDTRNNACHQGDIETDFALFEIDPNRAGWNIGGERYEDLTNSYGITPAEWGKIVSLSNAGPGLVLIEVLNMHSTMYHRYFNTEHSHSEIDDLNFNSSFSTLFVKYRYLLASTSSSQAVERYQALVTFIRQAVCHRSRMEEIVQRTVTHEKARYFNRA